MFFLSVNLNSILVYDRWSPFWIIESETGSFSLPQVARAGRFGTKGLAITFVSDETDAKTLNDVQDRFEVNVAELPEEIDISSYSKSCCCTQAVLHLMLPSFNNWDYVLFVHPYPSLNLFGVTC